MYCSAKIDHTKPLSATILPVVERLLLSIDGDAVTEDQDIVIYRSMLEDTITATTEEVRL